MTNYIFYYYISGIKYIMNILENKDLSYFIRYKKAIYQLLFKPHQFYSEPIEKFLTTPAKFYLLTHYFFFIISLPFLTDFLLRMRFFLRIQGYLDTANIFILNTKNFVFLNILVFPLITLLFWFLIGIYFRFLLKKFKPRLRELYFKLMTAQTASLFPTMLFMGIFFILDATMPQSILWLSIVFFGAPVVFLCITYYLFRRALRINYKISKGIIHLYLLSPLFILFLILFTIYIYGIISV